MIDYRQRLAAVAGILLGGLILLVAIYFIIFSKERLYTVTFGNEAIKVRLADNEKERTQGLSGTKQLGERRGLLFVFEDNGFWGIWMKDMNYPIDIVWLNERKEVVHIEQHILPQSYPKTFMPPVPARYVLELPADATEKYDIKQGDQANFHLP